MARLPLLIAAVCVAVPAAAADDCVRADVDVSFLFWWGFKLGECKTVNLNNVTLGLSGTKALTRALLNNAILKSLKLEECGIDTPGAVELAKVLPTTAVESMDLDGNRIGAEGAVAIAAAIPTSKVHELDLEANGISDEGAIALAAALRNQRSSPLTKLDLEHNGIGGSGVVALATALRKNRALTELDLHGNYVSTKAIRAMVAALRVNQRVTHLSVPEADPMLSLRTRRYFNTMSMLLQKLVVANGAGASVARKRAMLSRALKRFKARRRSGRRKG